VASDQSFRPHPLAPATLRPLTFSQDWQGGLALIGYDLGPLRAAVIGEKFRLSRSLSVNTFESTYQQK